MSTTFTSTLQSLHTLADKQKNVTIGHILDAFGHRSYGPFFVVPTSLELTPIGSIPGVPTLMATLIVLFGLQIVWGRQHIWLPQALLRRKVSSAKLQNAVGSMHKPAGWLDTIFHGRLTRLTRGPFVRIAALLCVALALTVPPLEVFPFATSIPILVILLFGLALLLRDGLLMLATFALTFGAAYFILNVSGLIS